MMDFVFFYGKQNVFSNLHPAVFYIEKRMFNSVEQYYQFHKALTFGDQTATKMIMREDNPYKIKVYGKGVKGFDDNQWLKQCLQVLYNGNKEKYKQNATMRHQLFATRGKLMVEASPYDSKFGVGMSSFNPNIYNQEMWAGANWMGYILTQVREDLLKEYGEDHPTRAITWTWQSLIENPRAKMTFSDRKRATKIPDLRDSDRDRERERDGQVYEHKHMNLCCKCLPSTHRVKPQSERKRKCGISENPPSKKYFRRTRPPSRDASKTANRRVKVALQEMEKADEEKQV